MQSKEYFDSNEDLPLANRGSVQTDEFELMSKDFAAPPDLSNIPKSPDRGKTVESSGISQPPSAFLHVSHVKDSHEGSGGVVEVLEDPHPAQASIADFHKYMITDGNWTDLFATSAGWMLLDFTFYLLGVNSSSFVPTMFGEKTGPGHPPYQLLISGERHLMEATSIGALLGSALAILVMHHFSRRKAQMWGYLILGTVFVVVGALYITLPDTNAHVTIVVFYGICQLFYNLGKSNPAIYRCDES